MTTVYCRSCGHKCMSDKQRCQICGGSPDQFSSEEKYGEEMTSLLSHKFRDYRLEALHKIRELRYEPAIPSIVALMSWDKDPVINREAIRTLKGIRAYQNRCQCEDEMLSETARQSMTRFDLFPHEIKTIGLSKGVKGLDHRKLRAEYKT